MLKMLLLKILKKKKQTKKKQCIAISFKCKLSLFVRDDTRQAISFIFIVVSQAEQVPKVQKKKKKKAKRDVMLFVLKRSYTCYYIICMTVPLTFDS